MLTTPIVLASASPRRSELLARLGVPFTIDAADVDEACQGTAEQVVLEVSRRKAEAVRARRPAEIILAADTVVALGGEILGKPRDERDAARMLRRLSGGWHTVHTGVCVIRGSEIRSAADTTRVRFTEMAEDEILWYVATGEPMDKAGAYALQGKAGMFIDRIEGCPQTVVGLPLSLTKRLLTF